MTATPTDIIDHNTFHIFHCENGILTFAYTYEEAVHNAPPYLCNFQVMKVQTKFQIEGINFEGTQLEKAGDQPEHQHPDRSRVHAGRMEEVFEKLYPQYHGELAKVLVSDDMRVYGKSGLLD